MRSDKNARPERAAHASVSPAPARETDGLSPVWRLIGAALALLCLLLLVWAAGHVHPEIASVSAAPLRKRANTSGPKASESTTPPTQDVEE